MPKSRPFAERCVELHGVRTVSYLATLLAVLWATVCWPEPGDE